MYSKNHDLTEVDKAIFDLRRGVTVVVRDEKRQFAVKSAEQLDQSSLDAFSASANESLQLIVTGNRLQALGLKVSSGLVYSITLADGANIEHVFQLTNPLVSATTQMAFQEKLHKLDIKEVDDLLRACVTLSKLARLLPAVVVTQVSTAYSVQSIDHSLVNLYSSHAANSLTLVSEAYVPLESVEKAKILAFRPLNGGIEHLAILIGDIDTKSSVLVRLHSECFTGDMLGSLRCDCGSQLRGAIDVMAKNGSGVLLYLAQEGRGIGLVNKLRAYELQDSGHDTVDANLHLGFDSDERNYSPAVAMLNLLGVSKVKLLTNNPDKVEALSACGVEVTERIAHAYPANPHNVNYLNTKATKSGHFISI